MVMFRETQIAEGRNKPRWFYREFTESRCDAYSQMRIPTSQPASLGATGELVQVLTLRVTERNTAGPPPTICCFSFTFFLSWFVDRLLATGIGETQNQPFQLSFNASLKVAFQGSKITSNGGLILVRELDERLGFATFGADDPLGENIVRGWTQMGVHF